MRASKPSADHGRRTRGPAAWIAGGLARAHARLADVVLPGRLGFGVVSPREIEGL